MGVEVGFAPILDGDAGGRSGGVSAGLGAAGGRWERGGELGGRR